MISVYTLGTARIDVDKRSIAPVSVKKFALLFYLGITTDRPTPRSILIDLLFPDLADKNAQHALRELIYQLRQMGARIEATADGLRLDEHAVRIDWSEVVQAVPSAAHLRAIEGGFMPGYAPDHSEAYSDWFEGIRAKAISSLSGRLVTHLSTLKRAGDWHHAALAASACLALDPLNESATLARAEMLAISGRKATALAVLDRYNAEVGEDSPPLQLPIAALRRRISERPSTEYRAISTWPQIGREVEMERLSAALDEVRAGHTRLIVIQGEPGIGKTRLIQEFSEATRLSPTLVEVQRLHPNDERRPMGLFVDLAPQLLRAPGAIGCAPESLSILNALGGFSKDDTLKRLTRHEDVSAAVVRAISDAVDAICVERTMCLIVEDCQWLDPMSRRVLAGLTHTQTQRRLMVILTTRSPEDLTSFAGTQSISLGMLGADATSALAQEIFASFHRDIDDELRTWMSQACGGNPFFLAVIAEHYMETGRRFSVPPSVNELVAKRIAGVSPDSLQVLRVAALLGKNSTPSNLAESLDLTPIRMLAAVEELELARLIACTGDLIAPDHSLVADVAIRGASPAWKRLAHATVAMSMEHSARDNASPSVAWDCAEHWIAAGEHGRALDLLLKCVDHATSIGELPAALRMAEAVLNLNLNPEQLREASRKLAVLAVTANEFQKVLMATNTLRRLGTPDAHDDAEIAELRTSVSSFSTDHDLLERRFLECVTSPRACAAHRIAAATLALKHASAHDRWDFAAAISNIRIPVTAAIEPKARLEFDMLAAYIRHEYQAAADMAMTLVKEPYGSGSELARRQKNAALATLSAGRSEDALNLLESAFSAALSQKAFRIAIQTRTFSAAILCDLDRDNESLQHLADCRALAGEDQSLCLEQEYAITEVDVLIQVNHLEMAADRLAQLESGIKPFQSPYATRWLRALRARLTQVRDGQRLTSTSLSHFLAQNVPILHTGIRDLEITVICCDLQIAGDRARAYSIAAAHVASQRHSKPLPRAIRFILGSNPSSN